MIEGGWGLAEGEFDLLPRVRNSRDKSKDFCLRASFSILLI